MSDLVRNPEDHFFLTSRLIFDFIFHVTGTLCIAFQLANVFGTLEL